jgi:hypothetical protein
MEGFTLLNDGKQWRLILNTAINVGSEVLTAVAMRSSVFWDMKPCSPLKVNRRFGRTCRLYPPKHRMTFNGLHGVISQTTVINLWVP